MDVDAPSEIRLAFTLLAHFTKFSILLPTKTNHKLIRSEKGNASFANCLSDMLHALARML